MECVGPVDTVRRMSTECSRIPSPTLGSSKCFLLAYVTYRWVVELQFVSAVWFNHVATCLVSPTQFSTKSSSQQEEQPQPLHHGPAFKKQPKIITCTPITQNTQPNGQLTNDQPNTPSTSPTSQPAQKTTTINHHLPAIYQHSTSIKPVFKPAFNQHLPTIASYWSIGHSLQGHLLMIFQSVLGFLNLLDEAGLIPWTPKLQRKLLGNLEEMVGFTKKLWMLEQWLYYAPNSLVMIVGNLIFGDPLQYFVAFHYVEMVKLHVPHKASWGTWLLTLCGLSLFSTLFT